MKNLLFLLKKKDCDPEISVVTNIHTQFYSQICTWMLVCGKISPMVARFGLLFLIGLVYHYNTVIIKQAAKKSIARYILIKLLYVFKTFDQML